MLELLVVTVNRVQEWKGILEFKICCAYSLLLCLGLVIETFDM